MRHFFDFCKKDSYYCEEGTNPHKLYYTGDSDFYIFVKKSEDKDKYNVGLCINGKEKDLSCRNMLSAEAKSDESLCKKCKGKDLSCRDLLIAEVSKRARDFNQKFANNSQLNLKMNSTNKNSQDGVSWYFNKDKFPKEEMEECVNHLLDYFDDIFKKNASSSYKVAPSPYKGVYQNIDPKELEELKEKVVFLPWIGDKYPFVNKKNKSPFSKRILVIADSHDCDKKCCELYDTCANIDSGSFSNKDDFVGKCKNHNRCFTVEMVGNEFLNAFNPKHIPVVPNVTEKNTLKHAFRLDGEWWWNYYIIGEHYLRPLSTRDVGQLELWNGIAFCNFTQTAYCDTNPKPDTKKNEDRYRNSIPMIKEIIKYLKPQMIIAVGCKAYDWLLKCGNIGAPIVVRVPHTSSKNLKGHSLDKQKVEFQSQKNDIIKVAEECLKQYKDVEIVKSRIWHFKGCLCF